MLTVTEPTLARIHTLGVYDGPTTTADRMQEAQLLATARCSLHPLYKRSPGDCLTLLYRAQALNISTGVALDHVYINTAIGRAGLSAQLMAAMLLRAGIRWKALQETDQVVELRFYRGRRILGTVDWRIREAVTAGLTRREHWRLWPVDCLWARAMARACRRFFADIVMGMGYTPEELHDMSDGDTVPDDAEVLPPPVQELLNRSADADADTLRAEIIPAARKQKLDRFELPDGTTVGQTLRDAWLVATSREQAARADAALGQPAAPPPPAELLDAPAGAGTLPCGCPTAAVLTAGVHDPAVCSKVCR